MKFCLVNGVQQNHLDIESRSIAYGDGLFTTAKIHNGQIQYLPLHIKRLLLGCDKLGITPPNDLDLLHQLTAIASNYSLAVLKVIISAASGGRGYARASGNNHDLIIMVHDYPQHYDSLAVSGIKLGLSQQQLGLNPMLSGLKHLNRLEQVLLRQELSKSNLDDLLVTNIKGELIEATSANVFLFIEDKLYTPDVSQSGVNGLMRQAILQRYQHTRVTSLMPDDIDKAQEIFICNCVSGVIPVSSYQQRRLPIALSLAIRNDMNKVAINHDD